MKTNNKHKRTPKKIKWQKEKKTKQKKKTS